MNKNTWIFGDVHGEIDKLKKCIEFIDLKEGDEIISLGDLVDRGEYSFEVIDYCIELQNKYKCIFIRGNHDYHFYSGLISGEYLLYNQGCMETLRSYIHNTKSFKQLCLNCQFRIEDIPKSHQLFFKNQRPYYIDQDNNCFVHGGFNRHHLIENTGKIHGDISDLWWDRDLLHSARSYNSMKDKTYKFKNKNNFKEIFIGHTPTTYFGSSTPLNVANIWDLDTGCGKSYDAKLTIMNLHTKEFWQA